MKLHEHEAKAILGNNGINVPKGVLVRNVEEVGEAISFVGTPAIIKAQVLVAGRGKAGGIVKVDNIREAEKSVAALLGSSIKGANVSSVLIEQAAEIVKELYLGFTIDRSEKKVIAIASAEGGVDLEDLASTRPEAIFKEHVDPLVGFRHFQSRKMGFALGLSGSLLNDFLDIAKSLYEIFESFDCELIESNPLCVTKDDSMTAVDGRMIIDDNSLFKHKDLSSDGREELTEIELEAAQNGLSYVELDGEIGIIGNGAGLVMATLDMVGHYGGSSANFLDVGGGARSDVVASALDLVLKNSKVKVILMNILGGITRCDEVALGIIKSLDKIKSKTPFVVRLVGTNQKEGWKILSEAGVEVKRSMEDAAELAVKISNDLK